MSSRVGFSFALALLVAFGGLLSARAAERIGIVLMHGKDGQPNGMGLAEHLVAAGYLVELPGMCWSRHRIYDLPYIACMRDVDTAVARLKTRGASAIVIGGQSMGGNFALGYGATHRNLKGIVVLAGAHAPQFLIRDRPEIGEALENARALVASGKGDTKMTFPDFNDTGPFSVRTTPNVYVSWFAPDGPAAMPRNAARLSAPLLWVSGTSDPTQRHAREVFDQTPPNPLNSFVPVSATHRGTPAASRAAVLAWLKQLAAN